MTIGAPPLDQSSRAPPALCINNSQTSLGLPYGPMSKALRLTPHAAPQIDFSCPVCDGSQANYIFSARNFRVFRCTGCALTFSESGARQFSRESAPSVGVIERVEKDHTTLIEAIEKLSIAETVLVLSDADDEIVRLLGRRGIAFTRVFDAKGFEKIRRNEKFTSAIVSDAIMRRSQIRARH